MTSDNENDIIKKFESCNISDLTPSAEEKAKDATKSKKQKAIEWGFPGHLTDAEVEVFVKFRDELNKRDNEFRQTVYSFTEEEGEANTLTRWLRARKYDLADTIKMVEEATECRKSPRAFDYYPDAEAALGCPPHVFIDQYPQLYSGFSKLGCPVFFSKPGQLEIDGIECITTLEGILKYHWHVMQHDYANRLLEHKRKNPDFQRFESVSILDLSHFSLSKMGSRTMDIIKKQAFIDSLCFPETMNKMVILNVPRIFTASWSIIKGFIDARTAAKVELFSTVKAAEKCLKSLIDEDQLPSDYGGTAESTLVTMAKVIPEKLITKVLYIKSSDSVKLSIESDEEADIFVYTQSKSGAEFHVLSEGKKALAPAVSVKQTNKATDPPPAKVQLTATGKIAGPLKNIKVKGVSNGSMFTAAESFLVVCQIGKK